MTCDEIKAALKSAQLNAITAQFSLSNVQQQAATLELAILGVDLYAPSQWTTQQVQNRIDALKTEQNADPRLSGWYGQLLQLLTQIPILQANLLGAQSMVLQYQTQMAQQGCQ